MPTKNKHHTYLLEQIKSVSKAQPFKSKLDASYDGHNEKTYKVSNPQLRKIVKSWVKDNKTIPLDEFTSLLNSIYKQSESSTEKYLGGFLIEYLPHLEKQIDPELLDNWLENLTGWAQIDSLCQSKFSSKTMLENWPSWETAIKSFNKSSNISKRRASLVLLTLPVRESSDERFINLAFENIDNVKHERDILITKATSWLLREMVKLHAKTIKTYLDKNKDSLPKIAVRETTRKLETGRK